MRSVSAPPLRQAHGTGHLAFAREGQRTIVTQAHASSPLRLLCPRNRGHGAWVYTATLGGGLVNGDSIDLNISAGKGSTSLVAAQSLGKVYEGPRPSRQRTHAIVEDAAWFAFIPDPVACFSGARFIQESSVQLSNDSNLVWLEGLVAGRVERGERWDFAGYKSTLRIERNGLRVVHEGLWLTPEHGDLRTRLGPLNALLTLVIIGPRTELLRAHTRQVLRSFIPNMSCYEFGDALLVRWAATEPERALEVVRHACEPLADTLGDDPFARKW